MLQKFPNLFCSVIAFSHTKQTVVLNNVGISLDSYLSVNPIDAHEILLKVVEKISLLHASGYLHLDIKAGNIAVRRYFESLVVTRKNWHPTHILIVVDAESVVQMDNERKARVTVFSNPCPPEILQYKIGTMASDVWLIGECFKPFVPFELIASLIVDDPEKRTTLESVRQTLTQIKAID